MGVVNANLGLLLRSERRAPSGSKVGVFKKGRLLRTNTALDVGGNSSCGVFIDDAVGVLEHSLNRCFTETSSPDELFNGNTVGGADMRNSIKQIESTPSCSGM